MPNTCKLAGIGLYLVLLVLSWKIDFTVNLTEHCFLSEGKNKVKGFC